MIKLEDLQSVLSTQLGNSYPVEWFKPETKLLGEVPEFDSMAVVGVLTAIEDSFGVEIPDDEVSAETFETVGTLFDFIKNQSA